MDEVTEPGYLGKLRPSFYQKITFASMPSGEKISDLSDASGTLWLDIENRDWSEELLAACGLTTAQMPALVEGSDASAVCRKTLLLQQWGTAGVKSPGGAGDNAASAIGNRVIAPAMG